MTIYYVSATGSDTNLGTGPTSAWRTITRVNTAATAGRLGLGDVVLFRRGDLFYGKLRPPSGLTGSSWLTFGAYGNGARPVLSSYKVLNTAAGWTQTDATTWQIDLGTANAGVTYTGYDNVQGGDANIGFLRVDSAIHGARVWAQTDLAKQWDFYCSGTTLYVRSSANPTTLGADIRAAVDGSAIALQSGLRVLGLMVQGSGGHGMKCASGSTYARIRINDCEIAEIGGALLTGTTRYGNGIEIWADSSDVSAEHNVIHDVYDTAYTCQGPTATQAVGWTDVYFRRNLVYRCSQSMEFWSQSSLAQPFTRCVAEYNTCLFGGYGWGAEVRPNQVNRVHLLTFQWTGTTNDLTVRRNIFFDAYGAYRYSSADPTGLSADNNIVLLRPGTLMKFQQTATIEGAAAWASGEGRDVHSQFVTLPARTGGTTVTDADVRAALVSLNSYGGKLRGYHLVPIHAPVRDLAPT